MPRFSVMDIVAGALAAIMILAPLAAGATRGGSGPTTVTQTK